jgi:diguanylate cyclase (GGDEF)-like protein
MPDVSSYDDHITKSRLLLIDNLWLGFACLAGFVGLANFWRATDQGWQPFFVINIVVAVVALFIGYWRRRLAYRLKSNIAVGALFFSGLVSMINVGMAGVSFFWLVQAALLAGTLYSLREGIIVMLLAVLVLIGVAVGYVNGWLLPVSDLNHMAATASTWINYIAVAPLFPALLLYSIGRFQNTIQQLLADVRRQRDALEIMASHDNLTGLPVWRLATDRLQQAFHAARRTGDKVALLFVDLDGFKAINDGHGHEAGDAVLQAIAQRMQQAIRAEDTAARIGGDEFVAVLARLSCAADAAPVAGKLIASISQPVEFGGRSLAVGASIGIAIFPDHAEDVESLYRLADHAMYRVKKSGKNTYAFADGEMLP